VPENGLLHNNANLQVVGQFPYRQTMVDTVIEHRFYADRLFTNPTQLTAFYQFQNFLLTHRLQRCGRVLYWHSHANEKSPKNSFPYL
jgi:hypothetical protein